MGLFGQFLQFLKNIVGLVSMVLSWQKEKKRALVIKSSHSKTKYSENDIEDTIFSEDSLALKNPEK